jgi:dimethylargininase
MSETLTAITRAVSPAMNRCELGYLERVPLDVPKAAAQHGAYEACLAELGLEVVSLPAEPALPDSVFVEDPAVVVDEVAVITRTGAPSRRNEADSLAAVLGRYRPLRFLREPATLEGGDILHAGRILFAGVSRRSNLEGIRQLSSQTKPFGYIVRPVEARGCLHLKSGVSALGDGAALVNRAWVDAAALEGLRLIDVPQRESWAANVLAVRGTVVMPACFPETAAMLDRLGYRVRTLDVSEIQKAEGGVTCMSILL